MRCTWLLVGAIALTACGSGSSAPGQAGDTLPDITPVATGLIEVSVDSDLGVMLAPETPAVLFEAAPGVEFPAGSATRWELSTDPPSPDEVRRLADLLGVPGEVTEAEEEFGGGFVVGSPESAGGVLVVNSFAEPVWQLQRSQPSLSQAGAIPCPTLAFDDPNAGQCANGASPDAAVPPSEAVVRLRVAELMAGINVPAASYQTTTSQYGSVVEANIEFRPDGLHSNVTWSLGMAPTGELVWGSGALRPPRAVDDVATVSLDEALIRLSRVWARGATTDPVGAVPPPTTLLAEPTTTPASTALGNVGVATSPPPTPPPGPIELPTIAEVEPGLAAVWDVTGRQWLVPAIVVSGDFGFTTAVPVIGSEMVRVVSPASIDVPVRTGPPLTIPAVPVTTAFAPPLPVQPPVLATTTTEYVAGPATTANVTVPVEPGSAIEPVPTLPAPPPDIDPTGIPQWYDEILSELLLGEPLDSAETRLIEVGWSVRTLDLDVPVTQTADLRADRVNLAHRDGIVTGVSVG